MVRRCGLSCRPHSVAPRRHVMQPYSPDNRTNFEHRHPLHRMQFEPQLLASFCLPLFPLWIVLEASLQSSQGLERQRDAVFRAGPRARAVRRRKTLLLAHYVTGWLQKWTRLRAQSQQDHACLGIVFSSFAVDFEHIRQNHFLKLLGPPCGHPAGVYPSILMMK